MQKNISFCSLFFCSFFSREVPSSGGAGGSDMGAERSSENFFFWPILLKSVQPKKILVGLAMLMQWGVFLCGVKKNRDKFTFVCVCVSVSVCLCLRV